VRRSNVIFASYRHNRVHIMFIAWDVTVVGDRLVNVNKSWDIEVRLVHTSQVMHTIHSGYKDSNSTPCITPVPGHSDWIAIGHDNGAVHL
jgi:hypothetical protein